MVRLRESRLNMVVFRGKRVGQQWLLSVDSVITCQTIIDYFMTAMVYMQLASQNPPPGSVCQKPRGFRKPTFGMSMNWPKWKHVFFIPLFFHEIHINIIIHMNPRFLLNDLRIFRGKNPHVAAWVAVSRPGNVNSLSQVGDSGIQRAPGHPSWISYIGHEALWKWWCFPIFEWVHRWSQSMIHLTWASLMWDEISSKCYRDQNRDTTGFFLFGKKTWSHRESHRNSSRGVPIPSRIDRLIGIEAVILLTTTYLALIPQGFKRKTNERILGVSGIMGCDPSIPALQWPNPYIFNRKLLSHQFITLWLALSKYIGPCRQSLLLEDPLTTWDNGGSEQPLGLLGNWSAMEPKSGPESLFSLGHGL